MAANQLMVVETRLTGVEKTAILVNVLGREMAAPLLKELSDDEVRKLVDVMGEMRKAPIGLINSVLKEFLSKISERSEIIFEDLLGTPESITQAFGEARAKQLFGTLEAGKPVQKKYFTALETLEPKVLAEFLVDEHPQTIAVILAHLTVSRQIEVLKAFPDTIRPDIVMRMASLEPVAEEKVDELDGALKRELASMTQEQDHQIGGVVKVAELINSLDRRTMNSLMSRLEDKDPILSEEIRQHIFTFVDMVKIDDRGIQLIIREVPQDKLLLALKNAPEDLREKVFASMSERASQMLRDDLQALGPQKLSDVESAQREIVKIIRRLEGEGKVIIGSSGEESEVVP